MRRGYALLAVLWVLAGASLLALGTALSAREAVAGAHNRLALDRVRWRAEGCLAVSRAIVDSALRQPVAWQSLDELRLERRFDGCDVRLDPVGIAVDLNAADAEQLTRLLRAEGTGAAADSLVQALQDWRDADDAVRPLGAERDWYRAHHRMPPRNGALASVEELRRVRGFEHLPWLDSGLNVEPGRVAIASAGPAVLASLPGLTPEAVDAILSRRSRGERPATLAVLADWIAPVAGDSLAAGMSDLARLAAVVPDAWLLAATVAAPGGSLRATVELRLALAGNRAAVVRRRNW